MTLSPLSDSTPFLENGYSTSIFKLGPFLWLFYSQINRNYESIYK